MRQSLAYIRTSAGDPFRISSFVYAVGLAGLGGVNAVLGSLTPAEPLPHWLAPETGAVAAIALATLLAGLLVAWRPASAAAAGALSAYYLIIVALLMDGWGLLRDYGSYGAYFGFVEGLALGVAALSIYAGRAPISPATAAALGRAGRYAFALCAVFFGGAHFVYAAYTASLVPQWLPPSPLFWAYATGCFQIAAGFALLANILARPAVLLLTTMYALFTPLVHLPLLFSNPAKHFYWTENAMNIALTGAAWVIADALAIAPARRRRRI